MSIEERKITKEDLIESAEYIDNERKVFGWIRDTYKIPKYISEDTSFNIRTFYNKALKAKIKGERTFTYKGQRFIVPIVPISKREETAAEHYNFMVSLGSNIDEKNEKIDEKIETAESNLENLKTIEQWL